MIIHQEAGVSSDGSTLKSIRSVSSGTPKFESTAGLSPRNVET